MLTIRRDRLFGVVALAALFALIASFTPGLRDWFVPEAGASTYTFNSVGAPTGTIGLATGSANARLITNPASTLTAQVDQTTGAISGTVGFDTAYTPVFDGPFHLKLYVGAIITQLAPISGTVDLNTGAITATAQLQLGVTVYRTTNPSATCNTSSADTSTCIETPATDQKLTDGTKCVTGPINLDLTGTFDKSAGTVHIADPQFDIPLFGNNAQNQPVCGSTVQPSLNQQLPGPNNSVDLTYSGTVNDSAPSITGVVTDQNTTNPIPGVEVRLYPNGTSYTATQVTTTDALGKYTFRAMPPGQYQVQFAKTGSYLPAWYTDGQSRLVATPLAVDENIHLTANQALIPTTVVGGTVTDHSNNAPLANTRVYLMTPGGAYTGLNATTDGSGNYAIVGVPPGTWDVFAARGSYLNQWYLNSPDQLNATPLVVSGPSVANFSLTADPPGTASLSGTVTDTNTALPIAGANVRIWKSWTNSYISVSTDQGGHYVVAGIPPGSYEVQYAKAPKYKTKWWVGATVRGHATHVALTATTDAIQDVTLDPIGGCTTAPINTSAC